MSDRSSGTTRVSDVPTRSAGVVSLFLASYLGCSYASTHRGNTSSSGRPPVMCIGRYMKRGACAEGNHQSFSHATRTHVRMLCCFGADGVKHGVNFSAKIKTIAAQEPFADLQDRLVGLAEITERISLERKNIMVRVEI